MRVDARALIVKADALLLIEFHDETGLHYNLPGGGVELGESIHQALQREVKEESAAEVRVGKLLWVIEYEPARNLGWAGSIHKLSLIFSCDMKEGEWPRMPDSPDPNQTAVRWIPLAKLGEVELLPHMSDRIRTYDETGTIGASFLQEPLNRAKAGRYLNADEHDR